jgi:hypothetical protein
MMAETVKAFPFDEYAPLAEYGEKPTVFSAQPFVTPAPYAAVPLFENEIEAEPLFAEVRPAALGFVSKSNQIVGTRPVTSATAPETTGAIRIAAKTARRERAVVVFMMPP